MTTTPCNADPVPAPSPNGTNGTPTAERNPDGKFAKGNRGGPGNPHARRVATLRKVLLDVVTPERFRTVVEQLVEDAENGNHEARKLLLLYAIGKPAAAADPDRLDLDEARLLLDSPSLVDVNVGRLPAAFAVLFLRFLQAGFRLKLANGSQDPDDLDLDEDDDEDDAGEPTPGAVAAGEAVKEALDALGARHSPAVESGPEPPAVPVPAANGDAGSGRFANLSDAELRRRLGEQRKRRGRKPSRKRGQRA
jgi:hypothetical protein